MALGRNPSFGNTGKGWWALNEQVSGALADKPAHKLGDYGVARVHKKFGFGTAAAGAAGAKPAEKKVHDPQAEILTRQMPQQPLVIKPLDYGLDGKMPTTPTAKVQAPTMPTLSPAPAPGGAGEVQGSTEESNVPMAFAPRRANFSAGLGDTQEGDVVGEDWLTNVRSAGRATDVAPYSANGRYNAMDTGISPATSAEALSVGTPAIGRTAAFSSGAGRDNEPITAEVLEHSPISLAGRPQMLALNAGPPPGRVKQRRAAGLSPNVMSRLHNDLTQFSNRV